MSKRLRSRQNRSISRCDNTSLESFRWFEEDLWTEIAKFLDAKSLVKLAATCRWFYRVVMDDYVWRFACVRDLKVLAPCPVAFKWNKLYASLVDGSHSYSFNDEDKLIDWLRIGAFSINSNVAVRLRADTLVNTLGSCRTYMLSNIKTGIWIADLQLVRCPDRELDDCGIVQTLEVRHIELFLCPGFQDGSWKHRLIGSYRIRQPVDGASEGIFDLKHLKDLEHDGVFDIQNRSREPGGFHLKTIVHHHSATVNTNLPENEGILTKFYTMKAGSDGEVVSIRISQQLL